ncbi:ribose transport system substrate-binding protein [Paenibacillus sophorae]|uniref:Ribose transport system substrate-binding protein n=1 Tax=Paenibacillus sophorae TaxID=1333845 RepID=A0A1H8NL11_9BACL|nr:substrate-binding domain-containing protein [Paenibacillus sophorae]QWU14571.1 substrate-binding domain-containing protein [Paenibacillus sophorae]SEO30199.1 ribose transport system substrate-binding protein [Paenibacillus sophorae]
MKRIRVWLTLFLYILMAAALSSCLGSSPPHIAIDKNRNIHMIVKMNKGEYWNTVKMGAEAAAKEFNVKLTFKAPDSESDVKEQIAMVEDSIKEQADVIILAASSYMGLAQVVDKAAYNRIPVISVDAEVGSARVTANIGSNGYQAGQKSAERLVQLLNGSGDIGILNFTNTSDKQASGSESDFDYGARDADEREKGFLDYVARYPSVHVVDISYTPSVTAEAEELTRLMLLRHPNLRGIAALNETASQGAATVLQERGLRSIQMVAFDSSPAMMEQIQEGIVQAAVIQNPFSNGYLAVKNAVEILQGIKVPERVDTGTKLIDLGNMLWPENQKLLFPFVR